MNYWIITVKEPYCGYILRGLKTMEIRRTVPPALRPNDVILIVRKGDKGKIVGACRVTSVLKESVSYYCNYRLQEHRLKPSKLKEYAGESRSLYGIGIRREKLDTWCLYVASFGYICAPRWFYRIKPVYKSTLDRVFNTSKPE